MNAKQVEKELNELLKRHNCTLVIDTIEECLVVESGFKHVTLCEVEEGNPDLDQWVKQYREHELD